MSLQFVFWAGGDDLDEIACYDLFADGQEIDEIPPLEDPDALEAALLAAYPTWTVEGRRSETPTQTMMQGPEGGAFDVGWEPQAVWVTCYGINGEDLNPMIDVMLAAGLRMYDPQLQERFAGIA